MAPATVACGYRVAVLANLRPVLGDVLLAVVLTALTLATLASRTEGGVGVVAYVLAALTVAPIALRQRAPVATMAVIVAASAAFTEVDYGDFPNSGIGMLVGMFTVATLRSRFVAGVTCLVTLAVVAVVYRGISSALWSEFAQSALILGGALVLGESTKRWVERAERLAEEQARAVADERVRIARELHDIVAHHMSVISLQAGLAQYVLDTDLPTARGAIATVGDTSREALTELRRLLDVLRVDQDADYQPQPGLALLPELVERTRAAGLPVELVVTGEPHALPPGPDLCAYRVAQESLTNVLKHAGPATARIELDYGERLLTLQVTDDGAPAREPSPPLSSPGSHGIRGMRERAELYGGVLTAGPARDGGFSVVVRLPTGDAS